MGLPRPRKSPPVPLGRGITSDRVRELSATAPKNRRLGPVELQGVGSTLDLRQFPPHPVEREISCKHPHSWKRRNIHRNNFPRLDDRVESAIFPADARHSRGRDESSKSHTDSRHPQGRGRIRIFHTSYTRLDNHVESSIFHTYKHNRLKETMG